MGSIQGYGSLLCGFGAWGLGFRVWGLGPRGEVLPGVVSSQPP